MFLKTLKLVNFRNFPTLDLNFTDKNLLLIGQNAQGKSNLLEAIYFLATSKSFRAEKDSQLIKNGESVSIVSGVGGGDTELEIAMQVTEGFLSKRVKVNGVPRRVVDYVGNLVVVAFSPEDINLVTGPPGLRRWHIDLTLAQVDKEYKRAISEYSEVITSRNRVLRKIKEGISRVDELEFWTEKLLSSGLVVADKRHHFFEFLAGVSQNLGKFEYFYLPSEFISSRLEKYQSREIEAGTTLIGPHRDDFEFRLNNQNLAFFGSRGEQRSAVLDLKLLELEYINHLKGQKPLLLLDDIFSELDDKRREHVTELCQNQQTIITAVENEVIPKQFLESVQLVEVKSGQLIS